MKDKRSLFSEFFYRNSRNKTFCIEQRQKR